MDKSSLAQTLALLRGKSGLTQEEVAAHLGVTKAAVSKWECAQSMPDISLLPPIAELFDVTINELFGRETDLTQDEANALYLETLETLSADVDAGIGRIDELARQHWRCPSLISLLGMATFAQIPTREGGQERPIAGDAARLASVAERLFRQALKLDSSETAFQTNAAPLARILQWTSRFDEARSLVESFVTPSPNLAALSLAQLHREQGLHDEAAAILQRQLLNSLVEAMGTVSAMAQTCDNDQMQDILSLAACLQNSQEYVSLFPMLRPTVLFEAARRLAANGEVDATLDELASFHAALDNCCDAICQPRNSTLFDRIPDLIYESLEEDSTPERSKAATDIRASYATRLQSDEEWSRLRQLPEFSRLVERTVRSAAGVES